MAVVELVTRLTGQHGASIMTSSWEWIPGERGARTLTLTLTAIIHKEVDLYVAECPEIGTVSQGDTVEDAIANLKEATELYLEEFPLPQVI